VSKRNETKDELAEDLFLVHAASVSRGGSPSRFVTAVEGEEPTDGE
jgi:hypothetical protein